VGGTRYNDNWVGRVRSESLSSGFQFFTVYKGADGVCFEHAVNRSLSHMPTSGAGGGQTSQKRARQSDA
jgi:hypothetical protein